MMDQNLTVWLVRLKVKKFADGLLFPSRFMTSSFVLYYFLPPVILSHISVSCSQPFISNFDAVMVFSGTDLHRWIPDTFSFPLLFQHVHVFFLVSLTLNTFQPVLLAFHPSIGHGTQNALFFTSPSAAVPNL
jgi:hypothetical protein